jgi:hypothetical protein
METAVEIDFPDDAANQHARELVLSHLHRLEKLFGRITGGRVVVKGPGGHHQSGAPYEDDIHCILLAGKEVSVTRTTCATFRGR